MAIIKCKNKGHLYDDSQFFQCPYCGITMEFNKLESIEEQEDKTVILDESKTYENTLILDILNKNL